MKRIFLVALALAAVMVSCRNFDIHHDNFIYTSGYFPYQFPVRTLVLGDYIYDNTNDNNHQFVISAHIGGVYSNDKDRVFNVEVDNSLCDDVLFSAGGDTVHAMPAKYYTLSASTITVPKGEMYGGVTVQLTDDFFKDSAAIRNTYVVPLRLVSSSDVDTILSGQTDDQNADPRFSAQWSVPPRNFTMFAVKYINEYHGTYFHYGKSEVKDGSGAAIEDSTYAETYVVNDPVVKLTTTARNQVTATTTFSSKIFTGDYTMLLNFTGDDCQVTAPAGSPYTISGTGKFQKDAYEWGDEKRDGIALSVDISDGTNTYHAEDVLVVRDRAVVMETYTPVGY
jgi:hypothetical protein